MGGGVIYVAGAALLAFASLQIKKGTFSWTVYASFACFIKVRSCVGAVSQSIWIVGETVNRIRVESLVVAEGLSRCEKVGCIRRGDIGRV